MKSLSCLSICCMVLMFCAIAEALGQQPAPGAGPPNPQIAQPLDQQALQNPNPGLSGSAAQPHPGAGAQNPALGRNSLPGVSANTPTPPNPAANAVPVQPIYQGSAANGNQLDSGTPAAVTPPASAQTSGGAQQRGRLGVWLVESDGPGVRIGRISDGSAAARAGLRAGDIVLQVNGRGATSPDAVARFIRTIPIGNVATLTLWRDGQQREMQVTMEPARESYEVGYRGDGNSTGGGDLSARLTRLEQQLATVTEEVQRLQREMMQMRGGTGSPGALDNGTNPGTAPAATPPAPTTNGAAAPPADPGRGSGTLPSSGSTTPSAPEGTGAADDLFGSGTPSSDQPK